MLPLHRCELYIKERMSAATRLCHPNGALRRKKDPKKRDGIKMYKRKEAGCCRCQDPICMNGKGLNCRGWGDLPSTPSPCFFLGGGLKGSCDAHDCPSLSRQGSVANEGLWASTRYFTLSASLTTPPCSPLHSNTAEETAAALPLHSDLNGANWSHR